MIVISNTRDIVECTEIRRGIIKDPELVRMFRSLQIDDFLDRLYERRK